jgi:hypothetical protein
MSVGSWRAACGALVAFVSVASGAPALGAASHVAPERLGSDSLLARIVRDGRVDYGRLGEKREQGDLARALARAGAVDPKTLARWPEASRLAFYLNVYNLATLDLVARERALRGGRLKSIQEIPAAWSRPRWPVAGTPRTLDEIEHQIVRKEFFEPRIHMALVCASVSCPALRPVPYDGTMLERQLEEASRAFVRDGSRNQFAPSGGRVRISKIFEWYGGDFVGAYRDSALERRYGTKEGAVLAFAIRYLPGEVVDRLRRERVELEYLPYDWGLNDATARAASPRGPGAP